MPLVRMLDSVAGPDRSWPKGSVVEMTPEEASVWADGVRGEVVRPEMAVETPEATSQRRGPRVATPEGHSRR